MVKVREPWDVIGAAEQFVGHFSRPVTAASEFYTLYYLVEQEGIDELDFELKNKARELRDSFYNYATYAAARELNRVYGHFTLDGYSLKKVRGEEDPSVGGRHTADPERFFEVKEELKDLKRELSQHIHNELDGYKHDIVYEIMVGNNRLKGPQNFDYNIPEYCEAIENSHSVFTDSSDFLDAAEWIFAHNWIGGMGRSLGESDNGWNINYGGDAWGKVCRTAEERRDLGDIAYVDLMWSVEHHNGNFVNKVKADTGGEQNVLVQALRRVTNRHEVQNESPEPMDDTDIYDRLLPAILDAARDGNIRFLFEIASQTITSVNIRRYRGVFDDDDDSTLPIQTRWVGY